MAAERTESKDRISGKICVYGHIRKQRCDSGNTERKNKSAVTGCADKGIQGCLKELWHAVKWSRNCNRMFERTRSRHGFSAIRAVRFSMYMMNCTNIGMKSGILTSHEQGASHAALTDMRATGKVGVCLATKERRGDESCYRNYNGIYGFNSYCGNHLQCRGITSWKRQQFSGK